MTTRKQTSSPPTVALLGAFERDNFGDILFLQLTKDLLDASTTIAAAPFGTPGDYRPLDLDVSRLADALREDPVDCVWVVGGEVGGTSMQAAYRMASGDAEYSSYSQLSRRRQQVELERLSSRSAFGSPYLPRMSASADSLHSRLVINSVGLSGLGGLRGLRGQLAWASVREADYISVRDKHSSSVLTAAGVDHQLAPDLVHTLRQLMVSWVERPQRARPLALLQVKEASLRAFGTGALANTIISSAALKPFDIELFIAGTARGHDSLELYEEVVRLVNELDPQKKISVSTATTPFEKAELIAKSDLWVGTSLHGWIISSSFEVPRVGLELVKLRRYAETWNDPMPAGVPLGRLDDFIQKALQTAETPRRAQGLAEQAMASFVSGMEVSARGPVPDCVTREREEKAAALRRSERSPIRRWATLALDEARAWRHR